MKRLFLILLFCGASLLPIPADEGMVGRELLFQPHSGVEGVTRLALPGGGALLAPTIDDAIFQAAAAYGVDPALIAAIIQVESSFNPNAHSPKGAMGLMQLMPATARSLGVWSPFNPVQNINGGTRYVRELIDLFRGNIYLVLAAYNAGPGAVQKYGWVPPYRETHEYIPRVLHYYRHFTNILRG